MDPCEEVRNDYRSGQLALLTVDAQRSLADKKQHPLTPEDFIIRFKDPDAPLEEVKVATTEEVTMKFASLLAIQAAGGFRS